MSATQASTAPAQLPSIPWAADDYNLVWRLIGLVEQPNNRKVLIGKGRFEVCFIFSILDFVFSVCSGLIYYK